VICVNWSVMQKLAAHGSDESKSEGVYGLSDIVQKYLRAVVMMMGSWA